MDVDQHIAGHQCLRIELVPADCMPTEFVVLITLNHSLLTVNRSIPKLLQESVTRVLSG